MKFIPKIWPLGVLAVVTACSGTMQGVTRGSGEPVQFSYEQGMSADMLTAVIDDETFQGKAVMRGASSTFGTTSFGTTFSGFSSTGDSVAVLLGSSGSSLSCQLQYADPSGITTSGGVGVCQHSDGRVIDIVW